ncbi:gamma-glutamyl-gamma-aminobutyrate hydrolase family protein [Robbsia sp. KACC 23696]|uniref:type 1 glutamine amidotransferase n=1 Tax=Robbsia sp. KACC 23696 TaxID=3149231 RepID=UPI00325B7874
MKVHVLQHVPFEGLGNMADWLEARNATVSWSRLHAMPALPARADFDLIIALGGPMSVNDEAIYPWLSAEKRFIADAIAQGTPVLGICLGAQLIAAATGARVYVGPEKEIGWHPLRGVPASSDRADTAPAATRFVFPASSTVFHWHGETFDLPEGAHRLAETSIYPHQAFQLGERTIGLQFHLETTPASVAAMLTHCADDLVDQRFVQTPAQMRAATDADYGEIAKQMHAILDYLCA